MNLNIKYKKGYVLQSLEVSIYLHHYSHDLVEVWNIYIII